MLIKGRKKDQELILDYLRSEKYYNIFLIGDILLYGFDQEFQDVYYQSENGKICSVLIRFHDVVLFYAKDSFDKKEILAYLKQINYKILQGKKSVIACLLDDLGPCSFKENELAYLGCFNGKRSLRAKKAELNDLEKINDAYDLVKENQILYPMSKENRLKMIKNRVINHEGSHYYIGEEEIICHANTAATSGGLCLIGGIFTLEKYRNQGYMKELLAHLCAEQLDKGIVPCVFYNDDILKKIVNDLGFKNLGKWIVVNKL